MVAPKSRGPDWQQIALLILLQLFPKEIERKLKIVPIASNWLILKDGIWKIIFKSLNWYFLSQKATYLQAFSI